MSNRIRMSFPFKLIAQRDDRGRTFSKVVFVTIGLAIALAGPAAFAEGKSDARARSVIFGEESRINILELRRQTRSLPDEQRFERLRNAVFPPHTSGLRIEIDFTPAQAAPPLVSEPGITPQGFEHLPLRELPGGELISPAIDLVEAAKGLDKLAELQKLLDARAPQAPASPKSYFALSALLAIAGGDFEAAREAIGQLQDAALREPVSLAERGPEAVAMWTGARHPETRDAARDLAFLVYEQARNNQGPPSERWRRHVDALKYLQQWLSESKVARQPPPPSASNVSHWSLVSRRTAETCGKGYPAARWQTRSGQARHITGHDHDYLYFASPLTGDFVVEADLSTFDFRDIQLAFSNRWAGSSWDLKKCVNGDFRRELDALPLNPPLTRMLDSMRVRLEVRQGRRTTWLNGRKVFETPHPATGDPWCSIHSPSFTIGVVSNLRIHGAPRIPEEITLAETPDLPGWLPYFSESAGKVDADWSLQAELSDAAGQQADPVSAKPILVGRRRAEFAGSNMESLLRYHRPMLEDGEITYEFFYRPDDIAAYPSLGRLCLLLKPDGVGVHWLTDGMFERTGLDPANEIQEPSSQRGDGPLPLRANAWNQAQLTLRGDVVDLRLNGKLVFERSLEPTLERSFGVFHYADQTEARVRNLRWRGEWPRELPPPAQQQLADDGLEQSLGDPERLPLVFEHDFSQGLPPERFYILEAGWEDNITPLSHGVRVKRPTGNYATYSIVPQLNLSGDFDITAAFENLQTSTGEGGEGSIHLMVAFDDERSTECRIMRKHYVFTEGRQEQLNQASIVQRRNGRTDYQFPPAPAEESSSGRLRLARRGSQVFFLYAEENSPEFRLIHSQQITAADTTAAGVRLAVLSHQGGMSDVVWKQLAIRAQSASGPLARPMLSLAELDRQRSRLPVKGRVDFSKAQGQAAFAIWGTPGRVAQDKDGLTIESLGADHWTGSGATSRVGLEGDFDVSLELEVQKIETPAANSESTVYLQTEFDDPRKTAIEIKFSLAPNGARAAEMQLNTRNADGSTSYRELSNKQTDTVRLLRLARRGGIAYLIFQSGEGQAPQVLARAEVGEAPVPASFLRAIVHTGGVNRKTIIRFKSLKMHAERLTGPTALLDR